MVCTPRLGRTVSAVNAAVGSRRPLEAQALGGRTGSKRPATCGHLRRESTADVEQSSPPVKPVLTTQTVEKVASSPHVKMSP